MWRLLPVALLAACASKQPRPAPTVEQPGRVIGEAELAVGRAVEADAPPALLLELKPSGPMPQRLAQEIGAGRSWLRVERPRGLSSAARDLLAGDGPFVPGSALLLFVQPGEGAPQLAEPALLRLTGRVDGASILSRIETIEPPAEERGDELATLPSASLRVLLGHGLDVLLTCAGSGELDTHHWLGVVDADGKPADWRPALEAARAGGGVRALAPYRVLVRRRHPGDPVPTHYGLRLDDVVVAAQARLTAQGDGFSWIWEGVWSARLATPASGGPAAWPAGAPPLEVRYKEYVRPSGGDSGAFWRGVFAPLALGADVGMAFLEGDGSLVDSVAERQRRRD